LPVTLALMLALIACPFVLWYVHTHPVSHTRVCSYRSYRDDTGKGIQQIRVYFPVYCDRPAGR